MKMFLVVVKIKLSRPFDHWAAAFDAHREARMASGVEDVFRYPAIGEQAVVYAVRTSEPRMVHDLVYDPAHRPAIEESGFVIGSEQITLCEVVA